MLKRMPEDARKGAIDAAYKARKADISEPEKKRIPRHLDKMPVIKDEAGNPVEILANGEDILDTTVQFDASRLMDESDEESKKAA